MTLKDTTRALMVYVRQQWRMLGLALLFFIIGLIPDIAAARAWSSKRRR